MNRISSYYGDGKFSSNFPAAEKIMKVILGKGAQRTSVRNVLFLVKSKYIYYCRAGLVVKK